MGKIYQLAKFVVIWLGEQADGSELLRGLVPALLEAKRKRVAANDERTLLEMTAADRKYYGILTGPAQHTWRFAALFLGLGSVGFGLYRRYHSLQTLSCIVAAGICHGGCC
jgi:hypothetical protein